MYLRADWKIIAIDINDPLAPVLNDINDIDTHMPGFLNVMRSWLKIYKIPEGKGENHLVFDGEFKGKDFALEVITETNNAWKRLMNSDKQFDVNRTNTQLNNKFTNQNINPISQSTDLSTSISTVNWNDVNKWHFIKEFSFDK